MEIECVLVFRCISLHVKGVQERVIWDILGLVSEHNAV